MKNLYIIGNGFDLHHDIKSSYGHFSNWLRENDNTVYQEMINLYGEEIVNGDWWNDFESNLGYLNFREIIEHHSWHNQPSDEDIEKNRSIDTMGGAWDVQLNVGKTIEGIKRSFHVWVNSLSPAKKELKVRLNSEDSFFINFNYTLTLETTYSINPERVCHIHGSINDDEYIIGHGRTLHEIKQEAEPYMDSYDGKIDPSEYGIDALDDEITENTKQEMIAQVMSVKKPVEGIIAKLQVLLKKFNHLEELYIFGLSFSEVDMPYLKTIFEIIPHHTNLTISYYSNKDLGRINRLMNDYAFTYKRVRLKDLQFTKQLELF